MAMAMDLMEKTSNGSGKALDGSGSDKNTLYLMGGVAMVVFGAGLVLANPVIRRYFPQLGVGKLIQNVIPDVERYFKLRAM